MNTTELNTILENYEMTSRAGKMAAICGVIVSFLVSLIMFCLFMKTRELTSLIYSGIALGVIVMFTFAYLLFNSYISSCQKKYMVAKSSVS